MMMDGAGSVAAHGRGLAARALRGANEGAKSHSNFGRDESSHAATGRGALTEKASSNSATFTDSRRSTAQRQDAHRFKQLAMITAVAVAVAFFSLSYGIWASASSHAAVEEATAGASSTLVSSSDIRAGDVLSASTIEAKNVPQSFRASMALDGGALEAGNLEEGMRALVDIPAGTQITSALVTGAEEGGHLAAELQSGMEAVTLAVDTETGLAGQVRAYDVVRIVSAESASSGSSFLETVCERARVIATGEGSDSKEGSYASVTIEVMPSEADAVREAQYAGRVSLLLVSSHDALEGDGERG